MRRRVRRLLGALIAVFAALLIAAVPASAHAVVVATDPADGARLAAVPSAVTYTFDENVGLTSDGYLHVTNADGDRVESGTAFHPNGDGTKVQVALRSGLGDGTYLVSYRVVSADSHPVSGSIRFVVGDGELQDLTTSTATTNPTLNVVYTVLRWLSYLGVALLGGLWIPALVWARGRGDGRLQRLVEAGWWACALGTLGQLLVQGAYVAGLGVGGLTQFKLIDATLHTTIGTADSIRLLLLAALAVLLGAFFDERESTELGRPVLAVVVALCATFAFTGHANAQHPRALALFSQFTHVTAMPVWLGGLAVLLLTVLVHDDADLFAILPRFSLAGYGAVAVLAISGTYQSWLGVGSWSALFHTRYGQLLLIKIGLFVLMLVGANASRVIVQCRFVAASIGPIPDDETGPGERVGGGGTAVLLAARTEAPSVQRLRRSVLAEAALGVLVLAVTAVLVEQAPGRNAQAASYTKPTTVTVSLTETGSSAQRSGEFTITPSKAGNVTTSLRITGDKPQSLTATAYLAAKQLGPITLPLTSTDGLNYTGSADLPTSGRWQFTFTVRYSEFDSVTSNATVQLH